jgi:hypothetical protein
MLRRLRRPRPTLLAILLALGSAAASAQDATEPGNDRDRVAPTGGADADKTEDDDDAPPTTDDAAPDDGPPLEASPLDASLLDASPLDESPLDDPGGADLSPTELPDELPPLDTDLGDLLTQAATTGVQTMLSGVELFGHGRLRLEVDEGRDLGADPSLATAIALTGQIGASLPVGPHRATIVLGEGQRFGQPLVRGLGDPPVLFPIGALGLIYELKLAFAFDALGENTKFVLGRQEFALADKRWIGDAWAHPRHRTMDGLSATWVSEWFTVNAGAFYLGPLTGDDLAQPSGFGSLAIDHRGDFSITDSAWLNLDWQATGYSFVHRDGTPARFDLAPLTIGTVGGRGHVGLAYVTARAGADFQVPVRDVAPLAPPGWGAHVEGDVSFAPHVSLFAIRGAPVVGVFGEVNLGQPTAGRALRAPAPNAHKHLYDLDLVSMDNVSSVGVRGGVSLPGQVDLGVRGMVIAMSDPSRGLRDNQGDFWIDPGSPNDPRWAFTEVDTKLSVNLGYGTRLVAAYAVALPGQAFGQQPIRAIQRLWLSLIFDASTSPG